MFAPIPQINFQSAHADALGFTVTPPEADRQQRDPGVVGATGGRMSFEAPGGGGGGGGGRPPAM